MEGAAERGAGGQLGEHPGPVGPTDNHTTAVTDPRTVVRAVEPLPGCWLRLTFADGAVHEIDLTSVLDLGGVFAPIRNDRSLFAAVAVDPEFGTIVWPGGVDLDPDVLRGDQQPSVGGPLPRRIVQPA
jgi:hypothetical protein